MWFSGVGFHELKDRQLFVPNFFLLQRAPALDCHFSLTFHVGPRNKWLWNRDSIHQEMSPLLAIGEVTEHSYNPVYIVSYKNKIRFAGNTFEIKSKS